ncbi:MAG TPA: hypothetical protein VFA19_02785 [Gaiellaceae bacterium]|nr:hypothetical protein [Gaiellaceae bacterium]
MAIGTAPRLRSTEGARPTLVRSGANRRSVERRPAVVAKCGWVNGLAAIRSLGRHGVPVVAVDYDAGALGFRSRYTTRAALCPDPLRDEEAFVAFMAQLGDEDAPRPIFPTNDELLNTIARNRSALGEGFLCPFPSWDLLRRVQSKRFQLEQAVALGIPCPETRDQPTEELGFPVLVKPTDPTAFQRRFDGTHAFRCETMEQLEEAYERAAPYGPLVQELIPGGDDTLYTVGAYVSPGGDVLGVFCGRKLRQTPPEVGTCRVGEALWVDEVVEQGLRYLRGLGYHGLAQVEFKLDSRDGRYKLMEINPRLWQWHGLAAACGVDLVQVAYRDLLGEAPAPVAMDGRRRRWAITLASRESPALVRPPYVDAVFARDDPGPALDHLKRLAFRARLVRGARRAVLLAARGAGPFTRGRRA